MKIPRPPSNALAEIRRSAWVVSLCWTLAIMSFLGWNVYGARRVGMEMAENEAVANINKDKAFRVWAATHGGVYVAPDEKTPPNPYLSHIPDRDISSRSGKLFTLMNPAYMLRQIQERYSEMYGVKGRITSLRPLNPINAPDEWEIKALKSFEQGPKELVEVAQLNGKPHLRMMQAFVTEPGCLKCHAHQGYKVGDIRGGIEVSIPLEPYYTTILRSIELLGFSHGMTWLIGLVGIFLVARRSIRRAREREEAANALQLLNATLEQRVQEEVAKNREKDHILIQQSRMAAMGEIIHNIAHQWRQPLTAVSIILGNIRDDYRYRELTAAALDDWVQKAHRLLSGMSATIDDFRDFFRPDQQPEAFDIGKTVEDALAIIKSTLASQRIVVTESLAPGLKAFGYPNQFAHAVLNLVVNAREAVQQRRVEDGRIAIRLEPLNGMARLTIEDNGGGVPAEILPKVFDPYFTTKEQGSGIGLYMAKIIVERNLKGIIEVRNGESGAIVTLSLPLLATHGSRNP